MLTLEKASVLFGVDWSKIRCRNARWLTFFRAPMTISGGNRKPARRMTTPAADGSTNGDARIRPLVSAAAAESTLHQRQGGVLGSSCPMCSWSRAAARRLGMHLSSSWQKARA
jgi:hypothetical protein